MRESFLFFVLEKAPVCAGVFYLGGLKILIPLSFPRFSELVLAKAGTGIQE